MPAGATRRTVSGTHVSIFQFLICQAPDVMCKDLWRFPLEWGNGNKYGKNNQRRAFEVGKTDSGKAGEVGKCRESMSAQQKESGKMGSGIQKMWRESFGTQSDYT